SRSRLITPRLALGLTNLSLEPLDVLSDLERILVKVLNLAGQLVEHRHHLALEQVVRQLRDTRIRQRTLDAQLILLAQLASLIALQAELVTQIHVVVILPCRTPAYDSPRATQVVAIRAHTDMHMLRVRIRPVIDAPPRPIRLSDAPVEDHVATLAQPLVASRTELADMLSQPRRINAVYVEINRAHRVVQPRVVVRVASSVPRITNRAITRLIPLRPASVHLTAQILDGFRKSPAHASSSGRPV